MDSVAGLDVNSLVPISTTLTNISNQTFCFALGAAGGGIRSLIVRVTTRSSYYGGVALLDLIIKSGVLVPHQIGRWCIFCALSPLFGLFFRTQISYSLRT